MIFLKLSLDFPSKYSLLGIASGVLHLLILLGLHCLANLKKVLKGRDHKFLRKKASRMALHNFAKTRQEVFGGGRISIRSGREK